MSIELSYLEFHALFVVPPILVLGWRSLRRESLELGPRHYSGVAIVVALAVVYTTPWDSLLIAEGVWWYGDGVVLATVWGVPLEEYLFFVLQPILTSLWLFQWGQSIDRSLWLSRSHRVLGGIGGLAIGVVGWVLLGTQSTFYLGAILAWAGPILAIQWAFGLSALWDARRTVLIAVSVPTLYLCLADRIAIELGIWTISKSHTTGYALGGLPIEEGLFFLVTNVFAVQGVVLYLWLLERRHELPSVEGLRNGTLSAGD